MFAFQKQFIELAISNEVLCFGEFSLKSGRKSPYFFNAGRFRTGGALATLGRCYAQAIVNSGVEFDMLFGPAYKGIPLAATTAVALADQHQRDVPFAYNRKEKKDHGEGGLVVGAPLQGKVLIIDDVITAGTAVREVIELVQAAGVSAGVALEKLPTQNIVAALHADVRVEADTSGQRHRATAPLSGRVRRVQGTLDRFVEVWKRPG